MSRQATDNSEMPAKLRLRLDALAQVSSPEPRVLDAYGGTGRLWEAVRRQSDRPLNVLAIDKRPDAPWHTIRGDNLKVLPSLDLAAFDLIDLDAYGVPSTQLAIVAEKAPDVPVFVTCILSHQGPVPHRVLAANGIPPEWSKMTISLFRRLSWTELWDNYCAHLGYRRRRGYTIRGTGMLKRYDVLTR